jgi:hypothetical protein
MKQRQLNLSKESIQNEKDLKRLNDGKSIQLSRDGIYERALRNKLAFIAKTQGDDEILRRLKGPANE